MRVVVEAAEFVRFASGARDPFAASLLPMNGTSTFPCCSSSMSSGDALLPAPLDNANGHGVIGAAAGADIQPEEEAAEDEAELDRC